MACDASKLSPMPGYCWRCGSPLEAGRLLSEDEGVFVEPAAATFVAEASVARQLGHIDESAADGAELVRAIWRDIGDYG